MEAPTLPRDADGKDQVKLGEAGEHAWGGPTEAEELRGDLITSSRNKGRRPWVLQLPAHPTEQLQVPLLGAEGGARLRSSDKSRFGTQS